MNYVEKFNFNVDKRKNSENSDMDMTAFVGAGGKTTTMFQLAEQLACLGGKVLITTTTMIFTPEPQQYNQMIVLKDLQDFGRKGSRQSNGAGSITVMGNTITAEGKLTGVEPELLNVLCHKNKFDYILVEADGSKQKPIKAPAAHEPVIPKLCTRVIGVIGMDSLGKPIDEQHVHRVALFCAITGANEGEDLTFNHIERLVESPNGLFQGAGSWTEKYVLLNKLSPGISQGFIQQSVDRLSQIQPKISAVVVNYFDMQFAQEMMHKQQN